jgi:hypothetical protein
VGVVFREPLEDARDVRVLAVEGSLRMKPCRWKRPGGAVQMAGQRTAKACSRV